ncbi:hypothetical protein AAC387_Pa01g4230 [Persea americana]
MAGEWKWKQGRRKREGRGEEKKSFSEFSSATSGNVSIGKKKKDSIVFFCHPHSDLNERGRRRAIPTDFNLPEPLLHSTWPHDRILLIV